MAGRPMSKAKRVTIRDVAEASGVSTYTVSSVLNGKGDIGVATTRKVREAMRRLHYNPLGSMPLAKRIATQSIGLVVPSAYCEMNPFYFRAIVASKEAAKQGGCALKLFSEDEMHEAVKLDEMLDLQLGCQGLVVFCPHSGWESYVSKIADEGVPVAVIRKKHSRRGIISLTDCDYSGMGLVLDHLHGLGHQRIAGVGLRVERVKSGRLKAYRDFCRKQRQSEILVDAPTMNDLDQQLADVLESAAPSAMACFDDQIAMHVCRVLRRLGRKVPTDVAVTGYNNDSTAMMMDPTLTTVNIPVEQMVRAACELLTSFNSKEALATEIRFGNELVIRESCGQQPK